MLGLAEIGTLHVAFRLANGFYSGSSYGLFSLLEMTPVVYVVVVDAVAVDVVAVDVVAAVVFGDVVVDVVAVVVCRC